MLSPEHLDVQVREGRLLLIALDARKRQAALEIARTLCALTNAHLGQPRAALLEAMKAVPTRPRDRRVALGLAKLVLDRCTFLQPAGPDPARVRATVWTMATRARRALRPGARFDRKEVLAEAGAVLGLDPQIIDAQLFADLPGAHTLVQADLPDPDALVGLYELGRAQAVLLRAVDLTALLEPGTPERTRALFRALKFHQLLYTITRAEGSRYRLDVDGPMSLFESVTRYGVRMALILPYLMACERWHVRARIAWRGRDHAPVLFELTGKASATAPRPGLDPGIDPRGELLEKLARAPGPWRPVPSQAILDLPGIGLCVPDLELSHEQTGQRVYFEQLGFWSRDAVWKRVELVRAGLALPIVFGVARHLRVSEAVLDEKGLPAALYVFAHKPTANGLLARVVEVASRAPTPDGPTTPTTGGHTLGARVQSA